MQRAPRLLIGFFVVILLFFFLRAGGDSEQPAAITPISTDQRDGSAVKDNASPEVPLRSPGELPPGQKDVPEKESMSDKLFDYLKGHSSHGANSHSPVPHEEHVAAAAPHPSAVAIPHHAPPKDPICASLPDVSDVLVVVRTPASDLYRHLPAHLLTDLRCVDFLLYSTVHQNIGPYTVHDALANISDSRRSKHRDFELYDKIQSAQNAVADLSAHAEDNDHNLDRWAILPHVLAAYRMRPGKKWYVYIESDTYLSVSNLMPWLNKMDHTRPIYSGAPVMIGDIELAHSGSGIVLSSGALEKLSHRSLEAWDDWEEAIGHSCCGDKILAEALKDSGVRLHRSFPMIQGETLFSLDWSERHWCRPAITWHRQTSQSLDTLWQFETAWARKHADSKSPPPMRFRDYFQMFLVPLIRQSQNRTDWDNLANSLTLDDQSRSQYAHYSVDSCRAACDLRQSCVQYAWEPNKCRLGTVVRWGEAVSADKRMISGWHHQRVERFGETVTKGVCSEDDVWLVPGDEEDVKEEGEDQKKKLEEEALAKDALQKEEELLQAKEIEEQRAKAEKQAKEDAEAESEAKEKALSEGLPTEDATVEKSKSMAKDDDAEQAGGNNEGRPKSRVKAESGADAPSELLFDHSGI